MTTVPLISGFYQARSLIAGAQRCLNLYPERNAHDAPFPYTCYPTPGDTLLASNPISASSPGTWRGLYTATTGTLYGVLNNRLYSISSQWVCTQLGTLSTGSGQVSMSDNRLVLIIVDGTTTGYSVDLTTNVFMPFSTEAYLAADVVDYIDTFFVFNHTASNEFFLSMAEIDQSMLGGGPIDTGAISNGGTGYTPGLHSQVPLIGGSGDATAAITVSGTGVVNNVQITSGGSLFTAGTTLQAAPASLGGAVTGGTIAGGGGYATGTYSGVPLTGGSGNSAVATITVALGIVTSVVITAGGLDYQIGDILSALATNLGGTGAGFTYTVSVVAAGGSGFSYVVQTTSSGAFDSLDLAAKTGSADGISTLKVMHNELWLLGDQKSSEIWYDAGTPDFALGRYPGVFVNHGCAAISSVAMWDDSLFWLGQNQDGDRYVLMGRYYRAEMISEPAMQAEIQKYPVVSDAIGFCYQQGAHVFYVLIFPTADTTWVYDTRERLWHERAWTDPINGFDHRIRANCFANAYGTLVVGDWQNGNLYALDTENFTSNGNPIVRRRGFPHVMNEGRRVSIANLLARMDVGTSTATQNTQGFDGGQEAEVTLNISTSGGHSWHEPRIQTLGSAGQYHTSPKWNQLGMGRDWVFELVWDFPFFTALQGAWIEPVPTRT